MKISEKILYIILFALIGFGIYTTTKIFEIRGRLKDNREQLYAKLETWQDEDSLYNAKIQTITMENAKAFYDLKVKDSIIERLQKLVKQNKSIINRNGGALVFNSKTRIKKTFKAEEIKVDTVEIEKVKYLFPVYKQRIKFKDWVDGDFYADKDTLSIDLSFTNKYDVTFGEEKEHWYSKPKSYVTIKNLNPYTETTEAKMFLKDIPNKRFGIGPSINVGLSSDLKITYSIGVSLQYSIIKF